MGQVTGPLDRLAEYAARPALFGPDVLAVADIADKHGITVHMERYDLNSGETRRYSLGPVGLGAAPARDQVDGADGDAAVQELIRNEVTTLNKMLRAHGIRAEASMQRVLIARSSFVSYGLALAPGEKIAKVEAINRELADALRTVRARMGMGQKVMCRVMDQPFAIETPHPRPVPLDWQSAQLDMRPFTALIGKRYYGGAAPELINLGSQHHMIVAAQSGGGKSTLMRLALCSLTFNTSPADLAILLVDLKNEDLVPFKALPHCIGYAGSVEAAAAQIARLHQLRDDRVAGGERTPRVLLIVDELAELADDKGALQQLGRILSTGRSLGINVWAGTQYPTASTIGGVVARSWTLRVVGRVDGAQAAQVATQRPGTGAQFLAHPGDFLRVEGPELTRFKAYWMPAEATDGMVARISGRWGALRAPALPQFEEVSAVAGASVSLETGALPVAVQSGALDPDVARIVRVIEPLQMRGASLAEMIRAVFGPHANTGGSNRTRVLQALELVAAATTTTGSGEDWAHEEA